MTIAEPLELRDVTVCAPNAPHSSISAERAAEVAATLKALADPARIRLLSIIFASEEGAVCVCDLTQPLGLGQPTVSHHLKILVAAGFLSREKRGTWAYFSPVPGALERVTSDLASVGGPANA
ncbi:ArsR/SmtB family transcription factor [Lysinibacter cavernae]|uniref:ArsR family transcriptional regulator n=1 Tax=Lysinibacter cavernae TaxID=1640652 RepID=A0A7X5R453_9MICO|nr:metalloregulator ArsR/SmtB family transcription factor [Lysinibacter cavernae]NIH55349.1 ArsR family transcriptional regulator [Lysinibacter cavernae]